MIGINDAAMQLDSARSDKEVLDEFEETYEKLLNLSLEKGMTIRCLTPFYIHNDTSSPLLQLTLKYIDRTKRLCSKLDIPVLDIHEVFQKALQKTDPAFWSGDGIHPYEHGHMLIARELFNEVCDG